MGISLQWRVVEKSYVYSQYLLVLVPAMQFSILILSMNDFLLVDL